MSLLKGGSRKEIKNVLRNAGRPLSQEEISRRTSMTPEETRETVISLVDQGELVSTLDWKYKLADN